MLHLIYWIIVGLIAGVLAKWAVPGQGPAGIIGDMVVGIVGAIIGGWLFGLLGVAWGGPIGNIVVAFIGGVILLLIVRAFTRRPAT